MLTPTPNPQVPREVRNTIPVVLRKHMKIAVAIREFFSEGKKASTLLDRDAWRPARRPPPGYTRAQ